jgi:NAD(P)-dependent dehydrogenase (short-subunit alcohol dehydrogenase family)
VHLERAVTGALLGAEAGQSLKQAGQVRGVSPAVQPAVADAGGAAERGVGVAADEDGDGFGDVLDDKGEYVAAGLGERSCRYLHHDVTSEDDWAAAVALAESAFGRLDVLVNNAGILKFARIAAMPLAGFRRVLEVNAVGCWLGMKAVTEPMKRRAAGRSSTSPRSRGSPGRTACPPTPRASSPSAA